MPVGSVIASTEVTSKEASVLGPLLLPTYSVGKKKKPKVGTVLRGLLQVLVRGSESRNEGTNLRHI